MFLLKQLPLVLIASKPLVKTGAQVKIGENANTVDIASAN